MSLNKVMLIGNVGRDPEVRYINGAATPGSNDSKVATFTLATSERFRDRSGEIKENTEWHNIVVWRGLADTAEKFVRKGTQLYVEGRLRTRSWTDQTGAKRFTTEIVADTFQLLGRRGDNPAGQDGAYPAQGNYQQPAYPQQPQNNYQGGYQQQRPAYQSAPVPAADQQKPIDLGIAEGPDDDLPF